MKFRIKNFLAIFAFCCIIVAFTACDNSSEEDLFPSLKVVNQHTTDSITSVGLVGYNFNSLNIDRNQSQTFTLKNGMPAGNNNININVKYGSSTVTLVSTKVNFTDGTTTTVTLKGSPPKLEVSY